MKPDNLICIHFDPPSPFPEVDVMVQILPYFQNNLLGTRILNYMITPHRPAMVTWQKIGRSSMSHSQYSLIYLYTIKIITTYQISLSGWFRWRPFYSLHVLWRVTGDNTPVRPSDHKSPHESKPRPARIHTSPASGLSPSSFRVNCASWSLGICFLSVPCFLYSPG